MNKINNIVCGNIYGGAFGDAVGGPIEMEGRDYIKSKFTITDPFLSYPIEKINPHGAHETNEGTITDDTRLKLLLVDTYIENRTINKVLINKKIIEMYHEEPVDSLNKIWLDEYYMKAVFGNEKQFLGGMQANAGAMCSSIIGLFYIGDSFKAFKKACELPFVSSYSMYAAGFIASLTSNIVFEKTVRDAILHSLDDLIAYKAKFESIEWRTSDFYKYCNMEIENVIKKILDADIESMNEHDLIEYLDDNFLQKYQYDAAETIAIVTTILIKYQYDFYKAVEFAITFGRDNDSSASIVGAIIGSKIGFDNIERQHTTVIDNANEHYNIMDKCNVLSAIIKSNIELQYQKILKIKEL